MTESLYTFKKMNFNGYEAYFLLVSTNNLIWKRQWRYVPAMANIIDNRRNTYVEVKRFPKKITKQNFFYFIHAQDKLKLDEFIREHYDIELYIQKLKEYLYLRSRKRRRPILGIF